MASKAKKRRNPAKSSRIPNPPPLISPAGWRRLRQLSLLGGVLGIVYLLVAMGSYAPTDPAFSHTGDGPVTNLAGPAGAWLADIAFQVFGYGAWSMAGLALAFSFRLAGRSLGGWGTGLAAGIALWSVLTGIALMSTSLPEEAFPPGGLIGLISAESLQLIIGPAGTWILVAFCLLGAAPYVLGIDWGRLADSGFGLIERRVPAAGQASIAMGGRILGGVASIGSKVAHKVRSGVRIERVPVPSSALAIEMEGPVDRTIPVEIPIDIEEPDLGTVATPTVQAAEAFEDLAAGFIEPPPADEPEDRTVVALPDLVEVEWEGTESGEATDASSAEPVSLDAALLASAVSTAEPEMSAVHTPAPKETEVVGSKTPSMGDPSIVPEGLHESGEVEITPGDLVSGGDDTGGLAVTLPEIQTPFELPHLDLLDAHARDVARFDESELQALAKTLETKLSDFGVKGEVVAIKPGPVITTFEYLPAAGIKISRIANLSDDIAMALKALRVRIVAPIPGKGVVGIEIPNEVRQTVWVRDMLASEAFRDCGCALPMALGKTVEGKPRVADLAKMPHLLVGGTTGSGKSVAVNAMLVSLLYTRTPEELRMILIDPKMLEFEMYRDMPHLLHPVVVDPRLASAALKWACTEMDARYRLLARWKTRNIANYNEKIERELEDWTPEKARMYAPEDWPEGQVPPPPKRLPYLVIVIDELADLMMVAAKDVEESIIRIAQKARAAGIHLIVATQRPSVNVITGLIKANMPSRVAFQVRTKVDGRTILDQNGAESLLGMGDMLFLPPGVAGLERLHGPFVDDDEVRRVTEFLRDQGPPMYEADIRSTDGDSKTVDEDEYDDLYDEAVAYVAEQGKASSSMIQRQFKIGYNRAARMIEIMEREGIVGAADGARPREVLVGQTG